MPSFRAKTRGELNAQWPAIKQAVGKYADGKGLELVIKRPSRNTLTNKKLHALMGDIRAQAAIELSGATIPLQCYDPDVCKAFLVRWFDIELAEMGEPLRKAGKKVVCPLTGEAVYVRPSTTEFSQKEAGLFVEWLYAFGVERGVKFKDPALEVYAEYKEAQG